MNYVTKLLTALAVLICSSGVAAAATLQAKVVEVPTGNTLVVSNTSRSVRIRLKSIMPPEAGQPFSEAARDHLRALVLGQTVTVDYTHLADRYLEARVFLNGIDVGSQMLRDGVAWYNHATEYELTESDRGLYAQCEQAARTERRGLWQDKSPLAPWEYHRIQQDKIYDIANHSSSLRTKSNVFTPKMSLSNSDFMGSLMGGTRSPSGSGAGFRPIAQNGSFDRWTSFESPVEHFSIMIPSNAVEGTSITPDKNGSLIPLHLLAAGGDRAVLVIVSGKGSNQDSTDSAAIDESIRGLIDGINLSIAQRLNAPHEIVSAKPVRNLSLGGYLGRQYSLTSNLLSGTVRVFTKRIGDERQIFVLYALTREGGEGIGSQFLDSFKIIQ